MKCLRTLIVVLFLVLVMVPFSGVAKEKPKTTVEKNIWGGSGFWGPSQSEIDYWREKYGGRESKSIPHKKREKSIRHRKNKR